jgi:putative ABC transport system permease protein
MKTRLIPLILKNIARHRVRMVVTTGCCLIAGLIVSFALMAEKSLGDAVNNTGEGQNLIMTQKDRYCPVSSRIHDGETSKINTVQGVDAVMPVKLIMSSCQTGSDIIAMHGVDKEIFTAFRDYKISDEVMARFREQESGAIVGDRIASRYGWKTGEQVTLQELGGISFKVCGIFTTEGSVDDFVIIAGRRFLQEAKDQQGISNRVLIRLKPGSDATAVCEAIDALELGIKTTTQPESDYLSASLTQIEDMVNVSRGVIVVVIAVILIAMGNAISMATRDRTQEFGIMRTLGFGKGSIFALVLVEGLIQAFVGAIIGCAIVQSLVWSNLLRNVSTCGMTVGMSAGPYVWLGGIGAICLATLVGGSVPATLSSRLKIVDAIKCED